ncbi:MAG: IS630 family transposase [bacterium]
MSQRVRMVLPSTRRRTVPEIADILEVYRPTVRSWIEGFNAEGLVGLYDRERSGRPPKSTDQVKDMIVQMIQGDPRQEGYLATCRTVAMLVLGVVRDAGVTLSPTTLRVTPHELGFRWGWPAMRDNEDPEKASKQWTIVKAVRAAGPRAAILYVDESRLHLLPQLRSIWHLVGEQIRIPTPGNDQSQAIFSAERPHGPVGLPDSSAHAKGRLHRFAGVPVGGACDWPHHAQRGQLQQPHGWRCSDVIGGAPADELAPLPQVTLAS